MAGLAGHLAHSGEAVIYRRRRKAASSASKVRWRKSAMRRPAFAGVTADARQIGSRNGKQSHGKLGQSQDADPLALRDDRPAHAGRIQRLRRAGLPDARRGPFLHGPQGPHRAAAVPRRMGGDAVLHRGAARRRLQMGVDPRTEPRAVQPAHRLLDPDLHPPRDRLPARHRRRQLPHGDADRRRRGGLGEMDGAEEFAEARHRRRRPHGGGRARHLQRGLPVGGGARSGAAARRRSTISSGSSSRNTRISRSRTSTKLEDVVPRGRRGRDGDAGAGADHPQRMGHAGHAHRRGRRRQEGRPGTGGRSSSPAPASSSTTSASAGPTARSTCRSPTG